MRHFALEYLTDGHPYHSDQKIRFGTFDLILITPSVLFSEPRKSLKSVDMATNYC